jgi:hypothetical protein
LQGELLTKVMALGLTQESLVREILTEKALKALLIEMERRIRQKPVRGPFRLRTAPG